MQTILTLHHLHIWLLNAHVDLASWGVGHAKTIDDLWAELQAEECQLHDAPPRRVVRVVSLAVRQDGRVLIEAMQEFGDGRTRTRNRFPAEKMARNEPPTEAALRCLREELPVPTLTILSPPRLRSTHTDTLDSPSYPGLPTAYTTYTVEIDVAGLPLHDFATPNLAHQHGDPVAVQHWQWQIPH